MTAAELNEVLKVEPCIFYRDEVFNVIFVSNQTEAEELKQFNRNRHIDDANLTQITPLFVEGLYDEEKFEAWYVYANLPEILQMQKSEYKERHNLVENFVFIGADELTPKTFLGSFGHLLGLGWSNF